MAKHYAEFDKKLVTKATTGLCRECMTIAPLKEPVREYRDTFSAITVVKEMFFSGQAKA